ncbi:MAG: glycosyltransferase family 2 protein [Planctomycetes bacterium]|nr:glycosyltransferase family 2 protein [Planctomycetota bacterium]
MKRITICALIPALNEELVISDCIKNLQQQSVDQIILVDGGSVDDTVEIALGLGVKVVKSAAGRGQQLDAGAKCVTADVVWMVHADCMPPNAAADSIRKAIVNDAQWGAFPINHRTQDCHSKLMKWCLRLADKRSRIASHPYGDQAIFVRLDLLQQVGGVPQQVLMEDIELCARLNQITARVLLAHQISVSPRRFTARPLRTFAAWMTFPLLYRCKIPVKWLARLYAR